MRGALLLIIDNTRRWTWRSLCHRIRCRGGRRMNPYVERMLGLLGERSVVASLEQSTKRIEAVAGKLSPARLDRSYAPGKWTARQILAHLADAEVGVGFRLRQALAEENHKAQPFDQDRWATRYPGL